MRNTDVFSLKSTTILIFALVVINKCRVVLMRCSKEKKRFYSCHFDAYIKGYSETKKILESTYFVFIILPTSLMKVLSAKIFVGFIQIVALNQNIEEFQQYTLYSLEEGVHLTIQTVSIR